MQHFHETLQAEHGIELSYSWVKQALQGPGLVARGGGEHFAVGIHLPVKRRRGLYA